LNTALDGNVGGIDIKKVLLWRFEVGDEVSLLPTNFGGVNMDFQDLVCPFELFTDFAIRRNKRGHDLNSFGVQFGGELLRRLDVPDPACLGEILVAHELPQEFAIQVNDGMTALSQGRSECDGQRDGSRALGARFEIARAETMLDRLMKFGAQEPDVLHLAGQSYRMIFRPDKAMECFQRVLSDA